MSLCCPKFLVPACRLPPNQYRPCFDPVRSSSVRRSFSPWLRNPSSCCLPPSLPVKPLDPLSRPSVQLWKRRGRQASFPLLDIIPPFPPPFFQTFHLGDDPMALQLRVGASNIEPISLIQAATGKEANQPTREAGSLLVSLTLYTVHTRAFRNPS